MNPLLRVVTEFRRGMLGRRSPRGRCWIISLPLAGYLEVLGHECRVIEGAVNGDTPHVWIELADGRTLDVTADQFLSPRGRRMPKVYLGELPKNYRKISHADLKLEHARKARQR